jgi:hypothetical protein
LVHVALDVSPKGFPQDLISFERMRVLALVLVAAFVPLLHAQSAMAPKDLDNFNAAFDKFKGDKLDCGVHPLPVFLDFTFRFEVRFIVDCPLRSFGGTATEFRTLLRVSPAAGKPVILGDQFDIPAAPPGFKFQEHRLFRAEMEIEFSGAFAVGEGEYEVELLAFDKARHVYRHSWKVKAWPHGDENKAEIPIQAGTVAPLDSLPFAASPARDSAALRLTLLLNAAPMNRNALKLRAWDRAFLLGSLASLLHQFPNASVRLVAFNLDQQQEIFRQEQFNESTLPALSAALRSLELGAVSYHTLERTTGWAELLANLVQQQSSIDPASNAVIFLGPNGQPDRKVPREMLTPQSGALPRVFYFEYFPRFGYEFPDAIHNLTNALKGRVFKLHSPGDLAENIQKMQKELDREFGASSRQPAQ